MSDVIERQYCFGVDQFDELVNKTYRIKALADALSVASMSTTSDLDEGTVTEISQAILEQADAVDKILDEVK